MFSNGSSGAQQGRGKRQSSREQTVRANYAIRSEMCRVLEDGQPPKMMRTREAVAYAEEQGLDLVEIGFDKVNRCSNCRICDHSKYVYDKKKREKEAKKQARANRVDVKSVQFSLTIDTADRERMVAKAKEFLAAGDKVKVAIRFKNRRESRNLDFAKSVMRDLLGCFDGLALLDAPPSLAGRELACVIRPKQGGKGNA